MVVGPDEGGTSQGGGTNTSIEFLVYLETAEDTQDLMTPLRDELLSADTAEKRRQEIARELAGDPQGGTLLLHLAPHRARGLARRRHPALAGPAHGKSTPAFSCHP